MDQKQVLSGAVDEEALIAAFYVFDPSQTGIVPLQEFIEIFGSFGEPLSAEGLEDLTERVDVGSDGMINYVDAIRGGLFACSMAEVLPPVFRPARVQQE